jgi:PAS domain S-box-containing protein
MTLELRIRRFAGWLGLVAAAIGLFSVIADIAGVPQVNVIGSEAKPIALLFAFCLLAVGLGLWGVTADGRKYLVWTCAGLVLGLAGFLVAQFAAGYLGLAQIAVFPRGGIVLLFAAIALFCAEGNPGRVRRQVGTFFAILVLAAAISSLFLLSIHRVTSGEFANQPRLGPRLATGLMLVGLGLLTFRSGGQLLGTISAPTPTGNIARRLFIGLIVLPPLMGLTLLIMLGTGLVNLVLGVALFTTATTVAGIVVALVSIRAAKDLDETREQAESARLVLTARLQEQTAQLTETVSHRTRELQEANASLRAVAEANARLALVASHATNGVAICNAQGRIEWVNAAFERLTGYPATEMRDRTLADVLGVVASDPAAIRRLRQALDQGEACNVELLNETKAGRPMWVIVDLQPVRDAQNRPINFIAVHTDITEQRQTQRRLETVNRRMTLANEAGELGIWEGDYASDRCEWDDRMLEIYGLTRETFGGTYADWVQRLHPEDAEEAQNTLVEIQRGLRSFDRLFRIIRADDGAVRYVRARAIARYDANGAFIGCTGAERDVTEEIAAGQKRQQLNDRLQLALDSSGFGVWESDLISGRMTWDDTMCRIYGVSPDSFTGLRTEWSNRLHPADMENATQNDTFQPGDAVTHTNAFRIIRDDGVVRHVESHTLRARDADGRVVRLFGLNRDVTAESESRQQLAELNERLQLALASSGFGVWDLDTTTGRMKWDAKMHRIFGTRPEDFSGTREDFIKRVHPEDHDAALGRGEVFEADRLAYTNTFRIIRPDGAVRLLESHTRYFYDAKGVPVRFVGINRDITEEHAASRRLVELNKRLQLALRSSRYGVWETDLITGRLNWDDRMLEIYGVSRESFDGQRSNWINRIHPEDRALALELADPNTISADSGHRNEYRIIRPDGTVRHIESHGQLETDGAGRPIRLVGLNRDISLERKTEAALHLIEERWQLALEGNNDGVWDWDIPTGHFFYDTRYSAMLGFALGELPTHFAAHHKLVHPDDRDDFEASNQVHLDGQNSFFQHEHRIQSKNGDWVWVLDRGKVVSRSADGRALRMVGTHTDITARKQLEQRIRQAEELSQQVGRLAQIGGWELKLDSGQLSLSEGARTLHELPGSQQPDFAQFLNFFTPEAKTALRTAMFSRSQTSPAFDFELPFISSTGRAMWVRVIGRAVFREGRAILVRGAVQDITARHDSENARRELEGQLFQAQKMETLGTLAGGIAHDFNNLLTGIIGYHELATDTIPEDHPARACLTEARGASMRARDLVEQILTFSRQSSGEEHEAVDLTLVLREAARFLRATLAANVVIETDIPEDTGRVLANTTQIYQVLLNLGSNAAHAMRPNGGTLRISMHPTEIGAERAPTLGGATPGRYLRLDLSDTGHGMDEATMRRIFDPFFTTKNSREGTGLGLAVVHGIIRAHRGVIDVESSLGVGTTFHIYLPVAEQAPIPSTADPERPPDGNGQSIFVVDDEELVGRFITLALQNIGYRVRAFNSGAKCLEALAEPGARCDLLLTDQTMPGLQGTELAAAAQKQLPELPVIVMSGYFSKVPTQSLGELHHSQLLAKPFTTEELAHALNLAWKMAVSKPDGGK